MPKNQGYDASKSSSAFGNMKRMLKSRTRNIDRAVDQAARGNEVHLIKSDHMEDDGGIIMTKSRK